MLERFLSAIRIRADVERKRLFGFDPLEDSDSTLGEKLYTPDATARTYQRPYDLARIVCSRSVNRRWWTLLS